MKARLLLASLFASLCGCSFLGNLVTPTVVPWLQIAVDVAVAQVVQNNKAKAIQVKAIAQQVLAADSGTNVALAEIETLVNAKIAALKLPPADLAAAQLLAATLEAVVQAKLTSATGAGVTAATQVAVATLCNDVILATSAYGV
jgi:hypothetical protein